MPVRVLVTSGTEADCAHAAELIEGIEAESLIADKGYDSDEIVRLADESGMQAVIPPRRNREAQREYGKYLYRPASGGERLHALKAMARHCIPVCQKARVLPGCRSYQVYRNMDENLLTTAFKKPG
jgi:IS5 family transposase